MNNTYELKLLDGSTVEWDGESGVDAALRYTASHPAAAVSATRLKPFVGVVAVNVATIRIIEPGDQP